MKLQFQHRFTGHQGSIYALVKGQDAGVFYSGAGDKIVAQWDINHTGDGTLIAKTTDSIYCMHFLPEQNRLLIGQGSGGVHIIDLSENKEEFSGYELSSFLFIILTTSFSSIYED